MKISHNEFDGVLFIQPDKYQDQRGFFYETWHQAKYQEIGIKETFQQDNLSYSVQNCLRGLHFQQSNPQGQLVWVSRGTIFDVCVDIRPSSKTFGQWFSKELTDESPTQIYMPPGFAHGFYVVSKEAFVHYKCTELYQANNEVGIHWQDPTLNISWPCQDPIISDRDAKFKAFKEYHFNG